MERIVSRCMSVIGGFIYYAEVRGEDGLRDGEMKPIISPKHTPQASRAGELDTIFDIRSFWEINTLMHRVFSLHLLGWM